MASTADGSGRSEVSATGQLLPVDLGLGAGATVDEHPVASQLAAIAGSARRRAQSASRRDLSTVSNRLLLVHVPERMGDRHRSEEHTSELQSLRHLVCRLLLE